MVPTLPRHEGDSAMLSLRFPLALLATLATLPAFAQVGTTPGGVVGTTPGGIVGTTPGGIVGTTPGIVGTTPGTVTTSPFGATPAPSITGTPPSTFGSTVGSTPALGNASGGGTGIVGQ